MLNFHFKLQIQHIVISDTSFLNKLVQIIIYIYLTDENFK